MLPWEVFADSEKKLMKSSGGVIYIVHLGFPPFWKWHLKKGSGWDLNVFESPWVRWQLSKENSSNATAILAIQEILKAFVHMLNY